MLALHLENQMAAFHELVLLGCTAVAQALEQNLFPKYVVSVLHVKNFKKQHKTIKPKKSKIF